MSKEKLQEIKKKLSRCDELFDKLELLKTIHVKEIDAVQCGNLGRTIDQDWLKLVFEAGISTMKDYCNKQLEELLPSLGIDLRMNQALDSIESAVDQSDFFNKDQ